MSEAFTGEVRLMGFAFAPINWALCNGQLIPIQQQTALFSILGTSYGGNGTTTFGLPNFQGNVAVGAGAGPGLSPYTPGESGGTTTVTINGSQLAAHTHAFQSAGGRVVAVSNTPTPTTSLAPAANTTPFLPPTPAPNETTLAATALSPAGTPSPFPHNNVMPYQAVNFCICISGIFPTRP